MSKFMDVFNVATGRDLDEDLESPKKVKKTGKKAPKKAEPVTEVEPKEEAPKRKPVATKDHFLDAYDYAQTEQVSTDLREALRSGTLSDDLSKLLQVLFDRKAVRELVSAQGDVCPPLPGPDEYYLDFQFVNPSGDIVNEQAEALIKAGTPLDGLEKFNITLKVVRKRKLDNTVIQEGTPEDYDEVREKITAKSTD